MKSCIYQKQTPVNIPQIETSILSDVLHLRYGFEIYSLLSRWNPLNLRRPYPLPYNGKNILVVGMGPAGYTLAHHLLNDGFGVVGIDGLRIEPLSVGMRGAKRRVPQPIKDINDITGPLDRRTYPRLRRRLRVRHHRPLGQEFPRHQLSPPDAPQEIPPLRRHPLRRHADT